MYHNIINDIINNLNKDNLTAQIFTRLKDPRSIVIKMIIKKIGISQIDDLVGFRIVVKDLYTCYKTRDVIHKYYNVCHNRFKNYISKPKSNFYQSLHTVIVTKPYDRKIEIQIRTDKMEEIAEFGTANHNDYKKNKERLFGTDFPKYLDEMLESAYEIMLQFTGTEAGLVAYEAEIKRVVKEYNSINTAGTKQIIGTLLALK